MGKRGPRAIDYAARARNGGRRWLLDIRMGQGLTQAEVARAAGISTTYYSLIELGVYNGSETVRENIAKALEFPYRMWEEAEV